MSVFKSSDTTRFILGSGNTVSRSTITLQRRNDANPKSSACPMALRRICGVCTHFAGPDLRSTGRCTKLDERVRGAGLRAEDCQIWERKSAAPAVVR